LSGDLLTIRELEIGLQRSDQDLTLVDGIDLQIRSGETLALVGESGCGKSITALALMRLLPPGCRQMAGEIDFQGRDLSQLSEGEMRQLRGGGIGMVFQEPMTSLNPVMRVGTQIAEAVRLHDKPKGKVRDRVVELLTAVGIPDPKKRAKAYPHQLSGGMKQRVMIAMALAGRPKLLIADEPTTALDVTTQAQVLRLLKDLQRQTGMAILLITHDLGVVAETADRLVVMYAGKIVESAGVREFFRQPKHPYGRMLLQSLPNGQRRDQKLTAIQGRVPPMDLAIPGCRFEQRCDVRMRHCRYEIPGWRELDRGGGVQCHLYAGAPAFVEREKRSGSVAGSESVSDTEILLEVRDLKVHFPIKSGLLRRVAGYVHAVDGIELSLQRGRTLALVGESGSGKSTVGKAMLQLIPSTDGEVLFGDQDLSQMCETDLRQRRGEMQIIFQDPLAAMNPRLHVGAIIDEGLRAQGTYSKAEMKERVERLLTQVGLPPDSVDRYPHEFSGGQRQRICIARALAVNPKLIVCDEPTSALDVSVQAQILNLLKDLQHELGLSYLFISHDISVVSYQADEVAVMYLGRIVESGHVEEVLNKPAHPYTRALLSAVPVPDPGLKREVIQLSGEMPSPVNPPKGCHFHPRCTEASAHCSEAYPQSKPISPTHQVACHLWA
jgi:peptide/nickel transport system ATP-binding protein